MNLERLRGGSGGRLQSFISDKDELRDFDQWYETYPRYVVTASDEGRTRDPKDLVSVTSTARSRLRADRKHRRFDVVVIDVHEDDGMTWSATAVDRSIPSDFDVIRIAGRPSVGGLPEIANLIGDRRFVQLAHAHHVTTAPRLLSRPVMVAALAAAIVVTTLGNVFTSGSKITLHAAVGRPTFFLPASLSVVLLIAARQLGFYFALDPEKKWAREVADELDLISDDPAERRRRQYDEFIRAVALAWAERPGRRRSRTAHADRCCIVDAYDVLDSLTKEVLTEYLSRYGRDSAGIELWIVFQQAELASFTRSIENDNRARRLRESLKHYEQVWLAADKRAALAVERGDTSGLAAQYYAVGRIRGVSSRPRSAAIASFLKQYREKDTSEGALSALRLLYLLAITAESGGAEFSLRMILGMGQAQRARVLSEFLGRDLRAGDPRQLARRIRDDFGALIVSGSERSDTFTIPKELGEALHGAARELQLTDASVGHLFWSIYWRDTLGSELSQAYWARKLATHLAHAAQPLDLSAGLVDAVREPMFSALLWTIDACLQSGLTVMVKPLLDTAALWVGDSTSGEGLGRASRLRRTAWQAFVLLADGDLLNVLIGLTKVQDRRSLPTLTVVERAFLATLGSRGTSRDAVAALSEMDEFLWDHVRSRGLLLGSTVLPWLDPPGTPRLAEVAGLHHGDIRDILRRSLQRLSRNPRASDGRNRTQLSQEAMAACVDLSTCSAMVWALAIDATSAPEAWSDERRRTDDLDLLDAALITASTLAEKERSLYAFHFAWRALTSELVVAVGAVGDLLAARCSGQELERLQKIVTDASVELGLKGATSATPAGQSDRLLALAEVTWQHLAYGFLAHFASIRRLHGRVVAPSSTAADPQHPVPLDACNAFLCLLAGSVAASANRDRQMVAQTLLLQAVDRALDRGLARPFDYEFSWMALHAADSIAPDLALKAKVAKRLLVEDGRYLRRHLRAVRDSDVPSVVVALENSLEGAGIDEVDEVTRQVRSRIDHIQDSSLADEALHAVDIAELKLHLRHAAPIDVPAHLARWAPRRAARAYPYFLYLLVETREPEAADEAVRYLEVAPHTNRNAVLLAGRVIGLGFDDPPNGPKTMTAARVLRSGLPLFESSFSAKSVKVNYMNLALCFPDERTRWRAKAADWQARVLKEEALDVREMYYRSESFGVLWHHFDAAWPWGLLVDPSPSEVKSRVDLSGVERRKWLDRWNRAGGTIPAVTVESSTFCLNGEFLVLGRLLSLSVEEDPKWRSALDTVDTMSSEVLSDLYDALGQMPGVPVLIKQLFAEFRRRFLLTVPT